jgi:hypothetical protein
MSSDLLAKLATKRAVATSKTKRLLIDADTWINWRLSTSPPDHQQSDRTAVVEAVFPSGVHAS